MDKRKTKDRLPVKRESKSLVCSRLVY